MDRIEQLDIKTRGRSFDILATAAIVYHPLRLEEMGTIAIMTDHLPDIRRLVKLCGCFLSIENDSVYFIHQSAKDYLVSDPSRLFTTAGTTSRHKNVFNSCIQTLSNSVWENDKLQEMLLDAKEFLRHNFSRIEQSPLQIYSSAFIFSPPRSLTRTMNAHRLSEWLDPESRGSSDETWSSCQTLILQGPQDCRVISATYSPDGKLIAAFCDQIHSAAIKIWNSANGLCLHVLPIPRSIYVNDSWLSFSSDDTLVSFYYPMDSKVRVWDTNTRLAIQSFDLKFPCISNLVFSADWKLLGFRIPGNPRQKLDWSSAQILSIPGDDTYPPHSWDQLQLWNLMDGKCIKTFAVPPASIVGLYFSDHTIIAGVLLNGIRPREIMLWDLEADKAFHYRAGPRKRLLHGGSGTNKNNNVALSPNGETIAEIESPGRTIRVWRNVTDQRCRQVLPGPRLDKDTDPYIKSLSFSGDSQLLLVVLVDAYGKSLPLVQIFDSSAWACTQSLGPSELPTTGILGAEFCPIDPDLVVFICRDGSVRIWSLVLGQDTKALKASQPTLHRYPIDSVLVFPNSRFAVSVAGPDEFTIGHMYSHDYYFTLKRRKEVIIWNTSTGGNSGILEGFPGSRNLDSDSDIIFNPEDNTLISCSHTRSPRFHYKNSQDEMHNSRRIRVWDFEKGNCLKNFDLAGANDGRFGISTTINISNDTKLLATSGSGSSLDTVQLWSLHNGDCLHSFPRSSRCGEYPIVEFSPDDKYIATSYWVGSSEIGSDSFEVRDTITRYTIGLFGMHSTEVISIAFSSAHNMIVSASVDGDIQLFDLENKLHHETTDGSIPHHLHTQRFATFGEGRHYPGMMKDSDCPPDRKDQAFEFLQKKGCLSIAFSPNGKTLVVAGYGQNVELWDITTEKCFRLQAFRQDEYREFYSPFAVIKRPRIEFLDDSDAFVWGPAHLTNRIIVPTASTFPDRAGVVHSGELIPVTKNSVFLDTDGLYVHGRRLLDISASYRPVKFDFKDGLFAIGYRDGRVYSIKVNLDCLLEPVA
ncbi:hypothetical protein TWF102_001031 [Orbilia oligospora]|uniref:Uncharacterized protein n=1 Tax=Orbilia oligospora TaxID=2813651 RepID=A0A7C8J1S4_ORBOL|nr:hypothetical protein TWF102_001031 [Orbilia oligospora]KAF3083558.1 hypothetical protein TWF706_001171 [Orbilia oligospora]KAF3095064.1 hypothetical protein TWF103_010351 [Orbilia oligospora]